MAKQLKFRIKELIAEKERRTGENVTYRIIQDEVQVSPNTLSVLATGKAKMVGIGTIERLLDYFECDVGDLIVYEE